MKLEDIQAELRKVDPTVKVKMILHDEIDVECATPCRDAVAKRLAEILLRDASENHRVRLRRGDSSMTKPKQWIERMNVRCKDGLHGWLLAYFGFEVYCLGQWWRVERTAELPFDLWLKWWGEQGFTIRFDDSKAVRELWCPVTALLYEPKMQPKPEIVMGGPDRTAGYMMRAAMRFNG